ncbi:reverse transcriptase [Caerostris darwini]|uniref:Reverse transcriptase n=1 Tax=Caerostris darwini TaxID=1538125 RepID=A0AAV4Q5Q0_9ARAC|nr:reverse transcriptase [Caerostris darwini]
MERQLASDVEKIFPMVVSIIRNDFCMNSVLSGAQTMKGAKELQDQRIAIYQREIMTLHKWFGNPPEFSLNRNEYYFAKPTETKKLGVSRNP